MLLGMASVRFTEAKRGVDRADDLAFLVPITDEAIAVDWERGEPVPITAGDLEAAPVERAHFAELPAAAGKAKSYPAWSRDLSRWLHRSQALPLWKVGREVSQPGESERDFRARLVQAARERRDADVARLRRKYAPRIDGLREKIRRAEEALARESEQATQSQLQTAISVGATLLGALMGRKAVSASTIGRATTAARGAGRVLKERGDVGRAQQNRETFRQQLADLEAQCETEVGTLGPADDPLEAPLETVRVQPTRQNIAVRLVTLAWTPEWQDSRGGRAPAWR
jgi:hypothetical protein